MLYLWEKARNPSKDECPMPPMWKKKQWECKISTILNENFEILKRKNLPYVLKIRKNNNYIRSFFIDIYSEKYNKVEYFNKYLGKEKCKNIIQTNFPKPFQKFNCNAPKIHIIGKMLKKWYGKDKIDEK